MSIAQKVIGLLKGLFAVSSGGASRAVVISPAVSQTGLRINSVTGNTTSTNLLEVADTDGTTVRSAINSQGGYFRGLIVGNPPAGIIPTYDLLLLLNNCTLQGTLVRLAANTVFGLNGTNDNSQGSAIDTGLVRAAAGVWKCHDGTNANWLQNTAGRARNTADATNATATMANLSDLSITLKAGRKYFGVLTLYANNSAAAEGLQFDFGGGTATMTSFEAGFAATPPGAGLALGTLTTTALATALTVTTATTADAIYTIPFSLVCNAAGTFIPRFAEISHAVGTATARLGSCLFVEDSPT